MSKIINVQSLIEDRVRKAVSVPVRVFAEKAADIENPDHRVSPVYDKTLVVNSAAEYAGSDKEFETWRDIHNLRTKLAPDRKTADGWVRNAAQAPSQAELAALLGLYFMDMTRRSVDMGDLTSRFATEVINPNFPKSVTLQEFYKFIVEFGAFSGTGESANQVEQRTGTTDTATITMKGAGHQTTLENILFNSLYNLQKVNQAVAEAYTDQRNAAVIAPILASTFTGTAQDVAAVQETTQSYDVNLYQTVKKALKALTALIDPQTGKKISLAAGISLAGNSADLWDIERVVRGQLGQMTNGVLTSTNLSPLSMIREMIEYDGGITDGDVYKNKTLAYPGFSSGYFYLFVPRTYNYILNKRGLTMEAGADLGAFSIRDSRLWYYAQGAYNKPFLGYAGDNSLTNGQGAIVRVAMPTAETET